MALDEFPEISLPVVGGDDGVWGTGNNNLHQLWARQLAGWVTCTVTSANVTLDVTQAQQRGLYIAGTPSANRTVYLQADKPRVYLVRNDVPATIGYSVSFRVGSNPAVVVPNGTNMMIAVDLGDWTWAISPAIRDSGGFTNQIKESDGTYRPGLFFHNDSWMGFSYRSAGVMGVAVGSSPSKSDVVRIQSANTNASPKLALGGYTLGFDTGFTVPDANHIAIVSGNSERMRIGNSGANVGQPAGGMLGHGWLNVQNGIAVNGSKFAPKDVGNLTLVSNGVMQIAHGLGYTPRWVQPYLQCTSGDEGYAVGDRIQSVFSDEYMTLFYNSTQVGLVAWPDSGNWQIRRKTGGSHTTLNMSSWRLWFSVA